VSGTLEVGLLGKVEYGDALAFQEELVARRLAGGPDVLLLLEHPPVYTLGRGADPRHLRNIRTAGGHVSVVRVSRGGEVTYHGPGQLVGYPILDLRDHRLDVRWYVGMLEAVLVRVLDDLGVQAGTRPGLRGVWVEDRKIASIGVALRRWVTWHGFALNVGADLGGFAPITPCGIADVRMTSVAREGGADDVGCVARMVVRRFAEAFGHTATFPLTVGQIGAEASA
jgi:lipoyl(octanoyl) transferase